MSKGLVLVSGVTGFVGTEVARYFVDAGFSVRGTARSQKKIQEWEAWNPEYQGKIEWVIVKDIAQPHAFDEAIKGVKYVAHTASPFHFTIKDNEKDMLQPAIQGTLSMIEAAKTEPSVEHVVITSSFAAILDLSQWPHIGHVYNRDQWNPATYEQAAKSDNPGFVYCASKVLAERAAWDDKDHKFAITAINPSMIYGPPHQAFTSMESVNTSTGAIWNLVNSSPSGVIPTTEFPVGVDVRDVAELHVRAIEHPEISRNKRFQMIAFHIFNSQAAIILRKHFAGDEKKLARIPIQGDEPYDHFGTDSHETLELLGRPFIGAEKSVIDTAERLWEVEAKLQANSN